MSLATALNKNLKFWHSYPRMLVEDLTPEQLRWQPDSHDTSILFALWHTYRAEDDLVHGLVMHTPSVFTTQGWAARLRVGTTGKTPFGNGLSREEIAAIDLRVEHVLDYAAAVGDRVAENLASLSDAEALTEVRLPFFDGVYEGMGAMSRLETVAFFAIGHTSEHLGEVQMLRGLMGLKGAPL
jgi:hypothetical protein